MGGDDWPKGAVLYEVRPGFSADPDGNGIEDLRAVIAPLGRIASACRWAHVDEDSRSDAGSPPGPASMRTDAPGGARPPGPRRPAVILHPALPEPGHAMPPGTDLGHPGSRFPSMTATTASLSWSHWKVATPTPSR